MFSRKSFVIAVLLTYFVLLLSFLADNTAIFRSSPCVQGKACVRFCCDDRDICSDEFISKYFSSSSITQEIDSGMKENVTYLFGRPDCSTLKSNEADNKWKFSWNWVMVKEELGSSYHTVYESDQYCLEANGSNASNDIVWQLKYCELHDEFNVTLHVALIFASILVITAALIVYLMSRSLRTLAGKYEFMLLLGILCMHCSFIWAETLEFLLKIGLLMTSFWNCVLMFEIWRAFRYRKATQDDSRHFLYFCLPFVACIVFMSLYFADIGSLSTFQCLVMSAFIDKMLLLHTSFMVFRMSKSTRSTDHAWFEAEKERFWKYLGIYFIMLIMWPTELYSIRWFKTDKSRIIPDVIILFSTLVIFIVLAWNNLIETFKRST